MDSSPLLLGTSSVPFSPVAPSPSALTPSEDGQYAIVTRGEINLFTLALGYPGGATTTGTSAPPAAPASAGAAASAKGKERERLQTSDELPLLRTVLPVEKKNVVRWADWVDEYDAATPGAVEAYWRAASWSPSGLSRLGGCILATLTTNAEVLLFAPPKDAVRGEWHEICDVTATLVEQTIPPPEEKLDQQTPQMRREAVAAVRRCQTSALAWSSTVPGSSNDHSLLALGHRSGEVTLWRYVPDAPMQLVHRFRPTGDVNWINLVTWSSWTVSSTENGERMSALLALADADGRVWSVDVSQSLTDEGEMTIKTAEAVVGAEADKRSATQLCWIDREPSRQLAYTKLGTVHLSTLKPDAAAAGQWTVEKSEEVELQTEGAESWMGATAWAPCSGLHYLPRSDSLLVALSSSSLHLLSLSPLALSASPSSAQLTTHARTLFDTVLGRSRGKKERFRTEASGTVTRKEGAKVLGFVGLGSGKEGLDVAYIFETERPDAFTHRTASGTRTYLTIANLAGGPWSAVDCLEDFKELLAAPPNSREAAPLAKLQSILHCLSEHASPEAVVSWFLQLLTSPSSSAPSPSVPPSSPAALISIFGPPHLEALRLRETIARHLLRLREKGLPTHWHRRVLAAQVDVARELTREVLGRLAAVVGAVELSEPEKPLHARLLLASSSLLPPSSTSSSFAEEDDQAPLLPPDALAQAYAQPDARCPACREEVPLANVRWACCGRGHQWERCSLTLALVSSVQVRTCTACERKALVDLPGLPADAVVNQVLRAATCCVFCGGRWRRAK
ncbi:hypothetical protein JCM10207_007556 [Rhodosporidiobolus poonsookiae]